MTRPLIMDYIHGGILVILKSECCPGQKAGYGGTMHSTCGCDNNRIRYFIANVTVLQPDETDWCLEQCLLARHAEQALTGQDV